MLASMRKLAIASAMVVRSSKRVCGSEEDDADAAEGPAFAETGLTGDEVADTLPLVQMGRGVGPALPLPLLGVTASKGAGVLTDSTREALGDPVFASAAVALVIVSLANIRWRRLQSLSPPGVAGSSCGRRAHRTGGESCRP